LKKLGLPSFSEHSLESDEDALCQLITTQVWCETASLKYAHSPKSLLIGPYILLGVKVWSVPKKPVWLAVQRNLYELGAEVRWSLEYMPDTPPPSDWTGQMYARLLT
jgi:hypothetical protein